MVAICKPNYRSPPGMTVRRRRSAVLSDRDAKNTNPWDKSRIAPRLIRTLNAEEAEGRVPRHSTMEEEDMKKNVLVACAVALALACPLAACGGSSESTSSSAPTSSSAAAKSSSDFDAIETYWGKWRGSVEITGQTVYGTAGGSEQMLDINLEQDGTCTVEPLEAHADLLTDSGTWEGTEDSITLHLDTAGDIVIALESSVKGSADASAFEISDFDTINFDFFG